MLQKVINMLVLLFGLSVCIFNSSVPCEAVIWSEHSLSRKSDSLCKNDACTSLTLFMFELKFILKEYCLISWQWISAFICVFYSQAVEWVSCSICRLVRTPPGSISAAPPALPLWRLHPEVHSSQSEHHPVWTPAQSSLCSGRSPAGMPEKMKRVQRWTASSNNVNKEILWKFAILINYAPNKSFKAQEIPVNGQSSSRFSNLKYLYLGNFNKQIFKN